MTHHRFSDLSARPLAVGRHRLGPVAGAVRVALFALGGVALPMVGSAAPLLFAQQPAGTGGSEPAPNVIISVDDSGSMGGAVGGGNNQSKMSALKAALKAQFGDPTLNPPTKGKVEDNRIRLAFQAMCNSSYDQLVPGDANTMKPFTGAHRVAFNTFVNNIAPTCSTPAHKMYKNALDYMRTPQGTWSPWADNPGTAQATEYAPCRRAYHIFMTDGGWNLNWNESVGNADGQTRVLPDGTQYNPVTNNQLRPYKDAFGGPGLAQLSTVADFAFEAWAQDLQDGTNGTANMPNVVKPKIRRSGSETVGGVVLDEYWNPKNNPATWQHMVNYTIGFGTGAYQWPASNNGQALPTWDGTTDSPYSGDYPNIVNGTKNWPNPLVMNENGRPVELWHAAINSRAKFYPARTAQSLEAAFADILDTVINDTSAPVVSISANSGRIRTTTRTYTTGYNGGDWSGYLKAYQVSASGLNPVASWNAGDLLNAAAPANRVILSHNGTQGIAFRWNALPNPGTQRTALNGTDSLGADRLDYLRGVKTKEGTGNTDFRIRNTSVLGDIVNSNLWLLAGPSSTLSQSGYGSFVSSNKNRLPVMYVGANDGMLHGFNAKVGDVNEGQEVLAYVPLGAYSKLASLTAQSYTHKYTVDGTPYSGDVKVGGNWKTYLAGFMGVGGRGYFVLDVTNPGNFSEANAAGLVVLDNTDPAALDADVGHIVSAPTLHPANETHAVQFALMNNDRPALLLGNGLNSPNERPVLLIQYLDGAREMVKLVASATVAQSNGLTAPQIIDFNGDGKADLVYAGDLQGNLWRFDVSANQAANWKVSFGGNPLFTAKDSGNSPQPILTAPLWTPHPRGGIMLGFGTGRNVTEADRTDTSEQSIYAVWDNSKFTMSGGALTVEDDATKRISGGRTSLVHQTMSTTAVATYQGRQFFTYTALPVNYASTGTNPNRRGWYMNFSESGERETNNPYWFVGPYAAFPSAVPAQGGQQANESCTISSNVERPFLTIMDLISGAPPKKALFDTDGGTFTGSEVPASRISNMKESVTFKTTDGSQVVIDGVNQNLGKVPHSPVGSSARWRER